MKITRTSHFIRYICQNYIKNILKYYWLNLLKKLSMASTTVSWKLKNFLQAFPMISYFKFVNSAIIFAFSLFLVCHRFFLSLTQLYPTHNNQGIVIWGVRSDVDAEIFYQPSLGFLACVAWHKSSVARCRVFQQLPSQSRMAIPLPGIWCRPPCWVRGHVVRWTET